MSTPAAEDPFGTAALREAALATWRRDPSRLRQDANLEEDHARGAYRDRSIVELAQNAADAATVAGEPGRLLLRLTPPGPPAPGGELVVANTGAPLTAEGVAALASLRASPKRGPRTVGRFGVGFSAVRAVSDDVAVATRMGGDDVAGVCFSLSGTRRLLDDAARETPDLAEVLAGRAGDLPALRLPFPDPLPSVPAGYTTAVRLRLREPAIGEADTAEAVATALDFVDDHLLLALPALEEIRIETGDGEPRVLRDVGKRWHIARAEGVADPELLADRPVEERERTAWSLTWALPRRRPAGPLTAVVAGVRFRGDREAYNLVHAPTPTDEASTLPALLVATLPLDPTRRRVATGRLTDHLVHRAGALYAELARRLADTGEDPLVLVPRGLPAGPLDGALHEAVLAALREAELLPEIGPETSPGAGTGRPGRLLPARLAQTIEGDPGQDRTLLRLLGGVVGGLVHVPAARRTEARVLGVAERDLGDVLLELPDLGEPGRWHALYDALEPYLVSHREALRLLPVPLHDGRVVHGGAGVVWPAPEIAAEAAAVPGLRVLRPGVGHHLLLGHGVSRVDAAGLLAEPAVEHAALDEAPAAPDDVPGGLAPAVAAVLGLLERALTGRPGPTGPPRWLRRLPLPTADGDHVPAGELALPGSWAEDVLDLDVLDPGLAARWDTETWRALGVRTGLTVTVLPDPDDPGEAPDAWWEYRELLTGGGAQENLGLAVVEDLDVVREDRWPAVLEHLAADPGARAALLGAGPSAAEGQSRPPTYTAWWLRRELAPFAHPRRPAGIPFLAPPPEGAEGLDDAVLTAVGAVASVVDLINLGEEAWEEYVAAWPAEGELSMAEAVALWRGLATVASGVPAPERADRPGWEPEPPETVPVLDRGRARMVPAEEAAVGTPMWGQVRPVVPAPARLVPAVAGLLDLPEEGDVLPRAAGAESAATPVPVLALLPSAPGDWWECEELSVGGEPVEWWVAGGQVWATTLAALARGLAHAADAWPARHAVEAVLAEPDALPTLLAETAGDEP